MLLSHNITFHSLRGIKKGIHALVLLCYFTLLAFWSSMQQPDVPLYSPSTSHHRWHGYGCMWRPSSLMWMGGTEERELAWHHSEFTLLKPTVASDHYQATYLEDHDRVLNPVWNNYGKDKPWPISIPGGWCTKNSAQASPCIYWFNIGPFLLSIGLSVISSYIVQTNGSIML